MRGEFVLYINHSGKYIEINFNVKIPFSSLPVPQFWALELFAVADPQGSSWPRLRVSLGWRSWSSTPGIVWRS